MRKFLKRYRGIALGISVLALCFFLFFLLRHKSPKQQEKQVIMTVTEVSKYMLLPADEQPVLATITNAAKLRKQRFFANAENGDKVLIYNKAKKALIYRPSTHKIIEATMTLTPLTEQ